VPFPTCARSSLSPPLHVQSTWRSCIPLMCDPPLAAWWLSFGVLSWTEWLALPALPCVVFPCDSRLCSAGV
jgi:hypothetical protein